MSATADRAARHSGTASSPAGVMLLVSGLEYGGAERQAVELVREMDRRSFAPFVCSLSREVPLADRLPEETDLVIVSKRWKFDVSTVWRVARVMVERRVSIVHAFLFDAEMVARLGGALARRPVVIGSERNADYRRRVMHTVCYRLTRALYDGVIANSQAGKRFAMRTLSMPDDRVFVVHNGVDVGQFHPGDSEAARRQLGIALDEAVVGMVAGFKPQKNHAMFLRMARRVAERIPRARFYLVGARPREGCGRRFSLRPGAGYHGNVAAYYAQVRGMIDAFGLGDRCVLLGDRDDVATFYNACDVTVLTSRHEGTPNVLLESMACGVPVAATDVSDNAIVVADGRTGYIVGLDDDERMADRVCRILSDPPERRRLGEAARAWVMERYSTTALARNTEAVYRELLRRKSTAGQTNPPKWMSPASRLRRVGGMTGMGSHRG